MSSIAVIPARYASTRFRGKPLANQTGKYLIQHVYEQVAKARSIDDVIVATDDRRIVEAVESFGGRSVMTRKDHPSGTDRVAEVAAGLDCEIVLNVQGDEPEIEPEALDRLVALMRQSEHPMATLACSFDALRTQGIEADPGDPNCVKVVCDKGRAIYFSRSVVPYERDADAAYQGPWLHLGTYAYRREFLLKLASLQPTTLERVEALEQLRVLGHGYSIAVQVVERAALGIDTPADYAAFVKRYKGEERHAGTKARRHGRTEPRP